MKGEGGSRIEWVDIPLPVRDQVEQRLGEAVVTAENQAGGFSPGLAARCGLRDGRRVFVKAVSPDQNPQAARMHRREAEVAGLLTDHAPDVIDARLLVVVDDGHWVCLVFDEVDGRQPHHPWTFDELDRVMPRVRRLATSAGPDVTGLLQTFEARHEPVFDGWSRLAGGDGDPSGFGPEVTAALDVLAELERGWREASRGDSLVHSDLRADNLLLTRSGEVAVVDWPHACRGGDFVDSVLLLCDVGLSGGPDPASVIARYRLDDGIEDEFRVVFCALLGFFVRRSLDDPPPGLPRLRAFQRAQALVGLPWLLATL